MRYDFLRRQHRHWITWLCDTVSPRAGDAIGGVVLVAAIVAAWLLWSGQ